MSKLDEIDAKIEAKLAAIDERIEHVVGAPQNAVSPAGRPDVGARGLGLSRDAGFPPLPGVASVPFADTLMPIPPFAPFRPSAGAQNGVPRHFAVLVGVCEYDLPRWSQYGSSPGVLKGCRIDVRNMNTMLRLQGGWPAGDICAIADADATVANVRQTVRDMVASMGDEDTFLYYESSHGGNDPEFGGAFLCLHDGPYTKAMIAEDLARVPDAARVAMVIDACHSGGLAKGAEMFQSSAFAQEAAALLTERRGSARNDAATDGPGGIGWITAASAHESSFDRYDASARGGEFTFAFCDGIRDGTCNNRKYGDCDRYADFYEAWNYAKDIATGTASGSATPLCINESVCRAFRVRVGK